MTDPNEASTTSSAVQHLPRFYVKQHFTVLVNRYTVVESSFHLRAPGLEAYGQERSMLVAVLRRVAELPLPVHFTFRDTGTGAPVLTSERQLSLRDRYTVEVPDDRVDFRLAASVAVGMDALLQR